MSRVRRVDTRPEMAVRRLAHRLGYRFRLHYRNLPGRPDLAFIGLHKAIFVHGCFWHRHEGCRKCTTPATRRAFWLAKFRANIERDRRCIADLKRQGWQVLVLWECETNHEVFLKRRLEAFLGPRPATVKGANLTRRAVAILAQA